MTLLAVSYWTIPAWGSVSLIDALWTAIGAASMINILWSIRPVYQDWRQADGILKSIAYGYLRRECIRLVQALSVLGVGIYACIQAPFGGVNIITYAGIALTAALFIIGFGIFLQSFLDKRLRNHLLQYLETTSAFAEQSLQIEGDIEGGGVQGKIKVDVEPKRPL